MENVFSIELSLYVLGHAITIESPLEAITSVIVEPLIHPDLADNDVISPGVYNVGSVFFEYPI